MSDHEPASARSAELLCLPVQPNLAPLVQLRLWSVVLRVPPDFEAKLLAVVLRNSEIEHGLPKHTFKVRLCLLFAISFYSAHAVHTFAVASFQCVDTCTVCVAVVVMPVVAVPPVRYLFTHSNMHACAQTLGMSCVQLGCLCLGEALTSPAFSLATPALFAHSSI